MRQTAIKSEERIGSVIGNWKVLSLYRKNSHVYFQFQCRCGSLVNKSLQNIKKSLYCRRCSLDKLYEQWIGKVSGSLTVKEIVVNKNRRSLKVICSCGKENIMTPYHFNKSKSCKSCTHGRFPGTILGRRLLLKRIDGIVWMYKCLDCGAIKEGSIKKYKGEYAGCKCLYRKSLILSAKEKIGLSNGYLKVSKVLPFENGRIPLLMKCKCGKTFKALNGHEFKSKSCGCIMQSDAFKGENKGCSRLKNDEVVFMREAIQSKVYSKEELCKMFNITINYLNRILNREIWKRV